MKTYKGRITKLNKNQVFVFGSNLNGFHGAGAAGFATFGVNGNNWQAYGYDAKPRGYQGKWNVKGIAEGFQKGKEGCSYAIPTVTSPGARRSRTLAEIRKSVETMYGFAGCNPDKEFLVAYSGEGGLSGYSPEEMASVFAGEVPDNVVFEEGFAKLVERTRSSVG